MQADGTETVQIALQRSNVMKPVGMTKFFPKEFLKMEVFTQVDTWLFRLGNHSAANVVFDVLMPVVTAREYMVPLCVALLVAALVKDWRSSLPFVLVIVAAVVVSDQSVGVLKAMVARLRPCTALDGVRLLIDCGVGKSFPSAHAANTAAVAVVVGAWKPRLRWLVVAWAVLTGYSRVYCGVHYPLDVLAGAVFGAVVGWCAFQVYVQGRRQIIRRRKSIVENHHEKH